MDSHGSPDAGEKTAQEQRDKAALEDKGALKPCEACGGEFVHFPIRTFLQTLNADGTMRRGSGAEMVTAMCRHCGLMRLHAAELLFFDDGEDDAG
jgi:hypothetical protein